jgi:glycosyltransferase involved in cell wall biosynthesis
MENKMISVCIPTLNEGKRLPALLKSLSDQKYKNLEIIVNDSERTTDETKEVLAEWSKVLKIKYINRNFTTGGARLEGAKEATGYYLMFIDADMQVTTDLLTECVSIMESGVDAINIPEEVIGEGFWSKCKWLEKRCYWGDDQVTSPRFMRLETYFEVGGHNPKLQLSEDKDLDIKFKTHNKKFGWSKNFLYHNEGRISIKKTFKSKFYWSQTGFEFLEERPTAAWKQVLFIFFRKAYFKNWKLLLRHPFLTIGMYIMKFAELLGAAIGGFGTKLGFIKKRTYKTEEKKS